MGLQLIVKNEDFSAISVGKLGLYTTINTDLVGLFCLSSAFGTPITNFAGGPAATIVGSPTVESSGVTSDQSNYIDFNIVPAGDRTMAFVIQNNGVTNTQHFSSFAGSPTFGEYLMLSGSTIGFESVKLGNAPYPSVASAVRDELAAVIIDNGVGGTLYLPRTGASATKASTTSQNLTTEYRTHIDASGKPAGKVMAFAYWSRVLTTGELDTFYNEMKAQLSALGVASI